MMLTCELALTVAQGDMEGEGIARKVTLNDGSKMPLFGLGVYRASPDETVKVVKFALQSGYRLIDTAAFYE